MSLGSRLQEARKKSGLTQQDVANKLGVSNGAISGYERDYRDPDTETLSELARLYGVSVDYLTGNAIRESNTSYEVDRTKEESIIEEKLKLADTILNLPDNEKNLVINMIAALKEKRKK